MMSSTLLVENTSDPAESESFNSVKQENDEMFDVKNKPTLEGNISFELYNEKNKYIVDQMIDTNGKTCSEEDFSTTWNSHFVKIETSEDFDARNDSTEHSFPNLGVKNEFNEMKVEEVTVDPYLISDKNHHMQNENTICTHSVKTELLEDINPNEESKYIINQIIDENDKVWPNEHFFTSCNSPSVKMEKSDNFNTNTECAKSRKKDVSGMFSSIQIEHNPPKFNFPTNLDSIHSKPKNHKRHSCHLCNYSSSWREALRTHIKSVHSKRKNHECLLCDYSSSWREALQRHIKSIHMKLKNHKCHLCDYSSSLKGDLHNHLKLVHSLKLKNHKWYSCSNISLQNGLVEQNIKPAHSIRKDHKCHLCDYCSSRKGHLQMHITSVHLKLKNHKCNLCDYSSSQKGTLQQHMKSVHLKLKNHECNSCGYSSSFKSALQRHIKSVHLRPKKHKCHLCDYSSSLKKALETHMKSAHL